LTNSLILLEAVPGPSKPHLYGKFSIQFFPSISSLLLFYIFIISKLQTFFKKNAQIADKAMILMILPGCGSLVFSWRRRYLLFLAGSFYQNFPSQCLWSPICLSWLYDNIYSRLLQLRWLKIFLPDWLVLLIIQDSRNFQGPQKFIFDWVW
jgi:hypothetical protein